LGHLTRKSRPQYDL